MASTNRGIRTYHVVPRFDIAAKNGPLSLGTIVADLKRLVPLNRGFLVKPGKLRYTPVTQTDFNETLSKAREGNFEAWAWAAGIPVGGSASAGASKAVEENVSCESVVTDYFDPDPAGEYLEKALAAKPIQDWLSASKSRSADLYLVTGLKVAKKLTFKKTSSNQGQAGAEISAEEPHTNAVEAGAGVNVAGSNQHELEFGIDDIVIGYRVNKYHCVRGIFNKERKVKDSGVLDGEMMDDQEGRHKILQTHFEMRSIPEETIAQEQAATIGADECWVAASI